MFVLEHSFIKLRRKPFRAFIIAAVAALMTALVIFCFDFYCVNVAGLDSLNRSASVTSFVCSLNGAHTKGLKIPEKIVKAIADCGYAMEIICTAMLSADITEEEHPAYSVCAINSIEAVDAFNENNFYILPEYADFLTSGDRLCIASDRFLLEHPEISVGSGFDIYMYYPDVLNSEIFYRDMGLKRFVAAGSFDAYDNSSFDILISLDCAGVYSS